MSQTHFFLALALPAQTKEFLFKWRTILEKSFPFKSWVHPEDLHITLAFLGGQASRAELVNLEKAMYEIAENHVPFMLKINGLGTFGKSDSPRILWAGVDENKSLRDLQKDVYQACVNQGFSLDKRPFSPHITMARRWKSEQPFPQNDFNGMLEIAEDEAVCKIEQFVLYQTHMLRTPKYQPITIFPMS